MKQQLIELFNIDKLNKAVQEKATAAFDKLLLEQGHPDDSLQLRVFIHALGGHRLDESIQKDLRGRICLIVEYERHNTPIPASFFKWDSSAERPSLMNEDIGKADFRWGKNESVKIDGNSDKIKVSDYIWKQTGSYGSVQEGVKS